MNRRSFFSAFTGAGAATAMEATPPKPKFITVPYGIMCLVCKRYVPCVERVEETAPNGYLMVECATKSCPNFGKLTKFAIA